MHSIFRIDEMKQIEDYLWQIDLTLTEVNDQQIISLDDLLKSETQDSTSWIKLAQLMKLIHVYDKAKDIYYVLLNSIADTDPLKMAYIYNELAVILTTPTATIDDIIGRMREISICQEYWKLLEIRLYRLRQTLNDSETIQKDIVEILKVIEKVISSCHQSETHPNGLTYKDLESLLIRIQQRLAQQEAVNANDYTIKIQILSDAYQEQQALIQNSLDKTLKQQLDTIEQRTKEQTIEQLRQLREKYTNIVESYLRRCIEMHQRIPVTGLTDDTLAEVAHLLYQITFEQQTQLRRNWQTFKLPFNHASLQFKSDGHTVLERNELRQFDNKFKREEESMNSIWNNLTVATPEKTMKAEDIIRTKRWIVIQGDPGSGKTSFVRWFVNHLAQTLLLNEQHSTDYGPLRIPILIHIEEFAEILTKQPSLTLFDYIGKHKWMRCFPIDDSTLSTDDLSCVLQDYVKHGQALIILDGLDVIPVSDQRSKIISIIENFVDKYVQTPLNTSVFDNPQLSRLFDDPSRSGGNQLVVTSRIVGYDAAPLSAQFAHYTVQPMDLKQIQDFIDYWFSAMHQHIIDTLALTATNQGNTDGEILRNEIEKPENIDLLDMASNCSLLSLLCTISFNQQKKSSLPSQRILLYEKLAHFTLLSWNRKRSLMSMPKLIRILGNIAFRIHEHSTLNCISEKEIAEICIQSIKDSSNRTRLIQEETHDDQSQISQFTQIILEDIGILVPQGHSYYSFRYKIIQEYFTSQKLIDTGLSNHSRFMTDQSEREDEIPLIAQSLRNHVNDSHFRVPIALALGKISSMWSRDDFDELCLLFLQKEQDETDSLLPQNLCILMICSNDLVNYPSDEIMFDVLDRIIVASNQHKWSTVCSFLHDHIIKTLKRLNKETVSLWINRFLSQYRSHDIQIISTFCHLIEGKPHEFENIQWLDQSICSLLQSLSILDNKTNEFAIDRLLIKIAFSNHQLLPNNSNTLKEFLLSKAIELNTIPTFLLPLIITLYGGLKRDNQTIIFDPSHIHRESSTITSILIPFLSLKDRSKQDQNLKKFKLEIIQSFLAHIDNNDESYETIDLCIATLCVYDIDYVQENRDRISNSLLQKTIDRLKYMSMILRQFYVPSDGNDRSIENETTNLISIAVEKFQYGDSARVQFFDFLHLMKSNVARLRCASTSILLDGETNSSQRLKLTLPNNLRKEDKLLNGLLSIDTRFDNDRNSCSLLHRFISLLYVSEHDDEYDTQYQMVVALNTMPKYLLLQNDQDLLSTLTFIPPHLQNLYLRVLKQKFILTNFNDSIKPDKQHLYFSHILTECLMYLSNPSCKPLLPFTGLIMLMPWLRIHYLDNFGDSLLWIQAVKDPDVLSTPHMYRQRSINILTGEYTDRISTHFGTYAVTDEQRRGHINDCIKEEQQRFQTARSANDGDSRRLYAASISLACICRWTDEERRQILLEDSVQGAVLITNRLVRLDALCVIAFYSYSKYKKILVNTGRSLQEEIEYQLNEIYPTLPLLLHTIIFLRCLPILQHQQTIDKCLQNLYTKFDDTDQRDRQAVNEALLPYILSSSSFSSVTKYFPQNTTDESIEIHTKSTVLQKYFNVFTDESLSSSVLMSNVYLLQLTSDLHQCLKINEHSLPIDELLITNQFHFEGSIFTEAQALALTKFLQFAASIQQSSSLGQVLAVLNKALHRMNIVEFKARLLLESWLKWKDSNEFSSFAYHATLLLANSNLWSIDVATILCDLLCCENDRFRQRTEVLMRTDSDNDIRTSSKFGLDIIIALAKKKGHYQQTSASMKFTLGRMLSTTTVDNQSHLETFLWLERYRIYILNNREYLLNRSKSSINPIVASYLTSDMITDAFSYANLFKISGDLIIYLCDMIASNFIPFLEIDGDATSDVVVQSHAEFVVSIVVSLANELNHTEETRQIAIEALMELFKICCNKEIQIAAATALSYICSGATYKNLFEKVQEILNDLSSDTPSYSNEVLIAFISGYTYCVSVNHIAFDLADIDLFAILLRHSSQDVVKAARNGFGRAVKDTSFLFETLGADHIQCYHALIEATAYIFLYDVQENSEIAVAEFIEQYPSLLSIFLMELYDSIRHFTDRIMPFGIVEYYLSYGNPQYVKIASLIAVRMPETFCGAVRSLNCEDDIKLSLFYTSKQHNFPQRAACLTILSVFGELTIQFCEMMVQALFDDTHIQNTCYQCITRITGIKDEKAVTDLLYSYLKSKSMNVRYLAVKILLHLVKSSLISYQPVRNALCDMMLDPSSNEDVWLIELQDALWARCTYHCAGPLKEVVYWLLIKYLIGDASEISRREELNRIDADFIQSERVSRLASCLYEKRSREHSSIQSTASLSEHANSDNGDPSFLNQSVSSNDDDDE
ncbi:hypothetical protein I4U23_023529 [Adineta vaga]|nr:hypothetical protein I4U23_023529 [Adineta vaga]